MSLIGDMPTFYGYHPGWPIHLERLEQFFELNNIGEDKKRSLLITSIAEDVYKVLREVCHPVLPKDKSYEELCEILDKKYGDDKTVFRERVKFYNVKQNPDERAFQWYERMKNLSEKCLLWDNSDAILLDRFISGMMEGPVLDKLCEEGKDLTIQQALNIAISVENSDKSDNVKQAIEE